MELSTRFRYIIAFGILGFVLLAIYQFRETLPIFIMALLLAYILTPVVHWMSQKKFFKRQISRGISVILIYIVLITGISFGGAYFVINLSNELQILIEEDIPNYGDQLSNVWVPKVSKAVQNVAKYLPEMEKLEETVLDEEKDDTEAVIEPKHYTPEQESILDFLQEMRFEVKQDKSGYEIIPQRKTSKIVKTDIHSFDLAEVINDTITDLIKNLQGILLGVLNYGQVIVFSVVSSIFQTLITLMIAAFIIIDHELIINFLLSLFPQRFRFRLEQFLDTLHEGLSGVVRGQLIICVVNGTLTGIGLFVLDVKFALTLSMVAMVSSLIPIFGVIISSVPIILMALTTSLLTAVLALGWILIIHFIEGNILNPKIIGKSAKIHPVLVLSLIHI